MIGGMLFSFQKLVETPEFLEVKDCQLHKSSNLLHACSNFIAFFFFVFPVLLFGGVDDKMDSGSFMFF